MIVFAKIFKIMKNGFYRSFICRPILKSLRFISFEMTSQDGHGIENHAYLWNDLPKLAQTLYT